MELLRRVAQQALQVTDEAVDVALPGRLVDDVLVIVVAQATAQLLVVHLGLVFPLAPSPGHLGEGWGELERGRAAWGWTGRVFLACLGILWVQKPRKGMNSPPVSQNQWEDPSPTCTSYLKSSVTMPFFSVSATSHQMWVCITASYMYITAAQFLTSFQLGSNSLFFPT